MNSPDFTAEIISDSIGACRYNYSYQNIYEEYPDFFLACIHFMHGFMR
jgi:hypothetical protein